MNFETIIVGIVAVLYASVGVSYALKGNAPWAIIWLSYSSANIGLIIAALNNKL
jgi:mannose/fructose/N-acetylgalactosamine-specific phosphotransferase system component IID